MADYDSSDIQFLDLTGLDEEEKKWLLNTLQIRDSTVTGPWNTPDNRTQNTYQGRVAQRNHLPQQNYEQFVSSGGAVIPNHITSTVYAPSYPQPHIILPQPPQQYVGQFPPQLVVNAPVVAGTNTVVPMNLPHNSLVQVSPAIVPVNSTLVPVNALPPIINNQFTPQIPYTNYPVQQPIKVNHPPAFSSPRKNTTPPPPPPTAHTINIIKPTNNEKKTIDNHADHIDNQTKPSVDNVNNIVSVNGCKVDANANEKHEGGEAKSWASLFNKPNMNAKMTNGVNDANKNVMGKGSLGKDAKSDQILNGKVKREPLPGFDDPNYYQMAEKLINYTIDNRIIYLQPRGLVNPGNYCYINSILQALLACPPAYNLLMALSVNVIKDKNRKHTQIIDNLVKFAKEFQHLPAGQRIHRRVDSKTPKKDLSVNLNCDPPFEPSWIYRMLNGMRSDSFVVEGLQEDAEEFLGCLLNGLNDEMLELIKLVDYKEKPAINSESNELLSDSEKEWQVIGPKNKGCVTRRTEIVRTPISDIFGGHIRSRLHRTGDHITYNIQPFFTLQLNIEKVNTVREALDSLVCKNRLEGVTSSKTNEEVEAWQQVTIEELPIVLILHLKCFDFKPDGCAKIIKALEFPIDLKIDSSLLSSKANYQPKAKQYRLFAVTYHDGKEATKGHYLTDAYHVGYGSWLRYDDAAVKVVQEEQVLKPQGTRVPYLLFYRRSDTVQRK